MAVVQKFVRIDNDAKLGERQVRLIASDATPDRVGDIMEPAGCDLSDYKANPIILAQHDPSQPIGRAAVEIKSGKVEALIDFAPAGVSTRADEYCGLAKHGIISAASVGFEPVESQPIAGGGRRYTKWKLLEISLVSIPANPSALVIERSATITTKRAPASTARSPYPNDPYDGRATDWPIKTGFDLWLKSEWPGLAWNDAYVREEELYNCLSMEARKQRSARKRAVKRLFADAQFEKRVEKFLQDRLSPEEQHERRLEIVAKLAPPEGPWRPYKWDPMLDPGTNSMRARLNEMKART